jgi:hypothetical protein
VRAGQPLRLDHRYDQGAYLAGGSLALAATDPDGDPVMLAALLDEQGTDGCTSHLTPIAEGMLAFDTRCGEATPLIGPAVRTIRVVAGDGNGGTTETPFPIEIGNRPPELRFTSNPAGGQVRLDHLVGACPGATGSCFLLDGTASFEVVDPDGDPVTVPAVAAVVRPGFTASTGLAGTAGGVTTFRFATAIAAPEQFRPADGTTGFSLVATAADPFGASARLEVPVVALNRPPVMRQALSSVVAHSYDPATRAYVAIAPLVTVEDPDGDPIRTSGSVGDAACASFTISGGVLSVSCRLAYDLAAGLPPLASFLGDHAVAPGIADGWERVGWATTVTIQDRAPLATPFEGVVDSCFCSCAKWSADGSTCVGQAKWVADASSVPLPVRVSDADGDPLQVSYAGAPIGGGTQKTVLPGSCDATLVDPVLPITVQVTVDDGQARTQTTSRVTGVSCSTAGQACVP